MTQYIGDFAEDEEIYHYFNTFDSNDPSASSTLSTVADTDIYVYKDGNIADIVTDGASIVIDFDGRTGVNKLTIDTSAHADYSTGSDYMVLIEGGTVDAGTPITAAIFTFSIENRFNAAFDRIGALGAGLTDLGGMSTGMQAEVQVEANDALVANHLDHLLLTTYDPASKPGAADALLNELVENNGGVSRYTAASLAQAPGGTPSQPLLQSTTILAYSSNTSFTLTTASADDDAYLNQMCVITDQSTGTQKAIGLISAYTGSSKTVTLNVDPLPAFTFANGDTVEIWAVTGSQIGIEVDANGRVDLGNVAGTAQTAGDLAGLITTVDTTVNGIQADLSNGTDGLGALSTDIGTAQADLDILTGVDGATLATAQALYAPATAAALATTDGKVDTISTNVDTVNTDLSNGTDGLGAIKADTASVKTKTDSLTFSVANQVDSNIISVDDAAISEGGSAPASPYGQT